MLRYKALAALTAAVLPLSASVAYADPTNGRSDVIPIQCGGQTFTITTIRTANGNEDVNTFTPGFVQGSSSVLIPVQFTFEAVNNATGESYGSLTTSKGQSMDALQGRLITCTFSETEGDFTLNGTVVALQTPQNRK